MLALEEPTTELRDLKLEMSPVWREQDELSALVFRDHGGGGEVVGLSPQTVR